MFISTSIFFPIFQKHFQQQKKISSFFSKNFKHILGEVARHRRDETTTVSPVDYDESRKVTFGDDGRTRSMGGSSAGTR